MSQRVRFIVKFFAKNVKVSINEAFSPLLGVDVTLQNNLTARLEYRQTRVLSLSMTSVQLNEASSKDCTLVIESDNTRVWRYSKRAVRLF